MVRTIGVERKWFSAPIADLADEPTATKPSLNPARSGRAERPPTPSLEVASIFGLLLVAK
jgi:hypothetical protein